jgi:tetratricopeptide (TPR) repeat protein
MFYPVNPGFSVSKQQWLVEFFNNFSVPGESDFWEGLYAAHPQNKQRIEELLTLLHFKPHKTGAFTGAGISKPYAMPAWGEFLANAAETMGVSTLVQPLLSQWRYPEVAQVLEDLDGDVFEEIIRKTFSHHQIIPELLGPGAMLPFLPFDYLITTNFDNVLEAIFQLAGMTVKPVIYGANPKFAKAAHLEKMLPLLKIHGDYLHERILTQKQYEKSYSKDSELYKHLIELFSSVSFLFVGFSLTDVEIKSALKEASRINKIPHFVILSTKSPENAIENDQLYVDNGVFPIWYTGGHWQVAKLLGFFVNYNRPDLNLSRLSDSLRREFAMEDTLKDCERLLFERPGCHASQLAFVNSLYNSANYAAPDNFDEVSELISRIDRALGRAPDFADAYALRAILNFQRYSINEVFHDLSKAIALRPESHGGIYAMRGMVSLQFRQNSREAKADFEHALKISNGGDPELEKTVTLYLLSIALFNSEDDALDNFNNFIKNDGLPQDLKELKARLRLMLITLGGLKKIGLMNYLIRYQKKRMKKGAKTGLNWAVKLGRAGFLGKRK